MCEGVKKGWAKTLQPMGKNVGPEYKYTYRNKIYYKVYGKFYYKLLSQFFFTINGCFWSNLF